MTSDELGDYLIDIKNEIEEEESLWVPIKPHISINRSNYGYTFYVMLDQYRDETTAKASLTQEWKQFIINKFDILLDIDVTLEISGGLSWIEYNGNRKQFKLGKSWESIKSVILQDRISNIKLAISNWRCSEVIKYKNFV